MPESCTCFLANREPLMGFSEVLLWQVRPGDCSILSAPCLPSRADPTVSAVLSPSAVSSFTLFQVPGPHPAAPVLQPRMLPSWGSRASHLETSLWWALWSRCWYGRWASLTMSLSTSVGEFRWAITSVLGLVHFHCQRRCRSLWRCHCTICRFMQVHAFAS